MPGRHSRNPSASSNQPLPARFTVPPFPPQIHRRLWLSKQADGLLLQPKSSDGDEVAGLWGRARQNARGVRIRWGVRGKVEALSLEGLEVDEDERVELGGVLGIVRLWDAAYLLVFLPPTKPPQPLFPNHVPSFAQSLEELDREAPASSHEVHSLSHVHAIPLVPDLADGALAHLRAVLSKRAPKKVTVTSTPKGKSKWSLPIPGLNISGPGTVPHPDETRGLADSSDSDSDEGETDTDAATWDGRSSANRSVRSLAAPEADEDVSDMMARGLQVGSPESERAKKRFSLGWGRFMPKLGKKAGQPGTGTPTVTKDTTTSPDLDTAGETPSKGAPEPAINDHTSKSEVEQLVPTPAEKPSSDPPVPPFAPFASDPPQRRDLETKILKQIIREYSSGGFFYSFDFDLTHSLQHKRRLLAKRVTSSTALSNLLNSPSPASSPKPKQKNFLDSPSETPIPRASIESLRTNVRDDDFVEPDVQVPLWRRVDRRFWWNEYLLRDFLDEGLHSYVLPVMQGWVQSATFRVPVPPNPLDPGTSLGDVPVDLVVISRRGRERAGLRYQRRGIDDEGNVANMVETEMVVRSKVEGKTSLFSFVQVRGSIPLKWSQSPYSMKPPPVLDQPVEQSYSVANLHFSDLKARYGPITVVNLSEQVGKEAVVTNGFHDLVDHLGRDDVTYKGFDFHAKCHGMKWENISELVDELDFGKMGYLWTLQGEVVKEQSGAFRTNCIDCLDRTNVVQSAMARHVLSGMLTQLGLVADPSSCNIETVFNDVWANNGDMLSLCYAHTSALKGDFVRTGKRDFQGMLHDGVSSISRMFYGAVSDFFAQAVISFMLGHRNLGVFSEFLERLESEDAGRLVKLSRVRAAAIETSSARVLSEGETRIAGWTLLSPEERNIKLSPKLEEKVLLLTKVAVYVVSFNYSLEKVIGFTRIPLASITGIQRGAYILSALQEAGRDASENAGFIINFSPQNESTRYSTYSIRNEPPSSPSLPFSMPTSSMEAAATTPSTPGATVEHSNIDPSSTEFFAFKVLPREFVSRGQSYVGTEDDDDDDEDVENGGMSGETCKATSERIVRRLKEGCKRLGVGEGEGFYVEKDVVSVAEAQQATSLLARMDYAVKRFLWL